MTRLVLKFGGTSMGDLDRIRRAARIVAAEYNGGRRVAVVVSVSAPSALAFDLCEAAGATLVGFARGDRHAVYCGAERLV